MASLANKKGHNKQEIETIIMMVINKSQICKLLQSIFSYPYIGLFIYI